MGHPDTGDRPAVPYSLMASCRLHEINPLDYLRDMLSRLSGAQIADVEKFIPSEWAKTKRSTVG